MSHTKGRLTSGVLVASLLVLTTLLIASLANATERHRSNSVEFEGLKAINFFLPNATGVADADIVSSLKSAISGEEEVELAQEYLTFAAQVKDLYDQITVDENTSQEISDFKKVLLKIVKYLTKKSSHPRMDLLKNQLSQYVQQQEQPQESTPQTPNSEAAETASLLQDLQEEVEEADSEWVTIALRVAGTAMNVANNIGTYHEKISKVGNFISGKAANALDRVGLKGAANVARKTGTSISNFSRDKIAPIEKRVAQKIAPVVKSKPFQAVRKTLNVVNNVIGGVTSIKAGLNAVGLARNVRLPRNFSALKSSLKTATRYVRSGNWREKARTIGRAAKTGYRNFKRGDWKTKYNAVSGFWNGASNLKAAVTGKSFGFSLPGLPGRWGRNNENTRGGNSRSSSRRGGNNRRGNSSRRGGNSSRRGGSRRNTNSRGSGSRRSSARSGNSRRGGNRRGNSRSSSRRNASSRRSTRGGRTSSGTRRGNTTRRSASSPRRTSSRRSSSGSNRSSSRGARRGGRR
ncbi:hypothetical protein C9374_003269 [Naegleria lovaniensis]|uniref:Uncharacterized protein n=1 Tax=Naegleria lovaniensis TaxID=51637 RepID=A0AA88GSR2_NAELO|nr:uncharacterized protein C9374_003269 [Naegleria lovaniensis]KAG2385454.1 hypothetical protein C9374_003269 [Naegleria lovaniensis]